MVLMAGPLNAQQLLALLALLLSVGRRRSALTVREFYRTQPAVTSIKPIPPSHLITMSSIAIATLE